LHIQKNPLLLLLPKAKFMDPLRILLVDDHQMLIDGIKALLRKDRKRYDIYLEAHNGKEALQLLETHHPVIDIVMTDISMPDMDGLQLTKEIKARYPQVKILVLSMHADRELVDEIIMSEAEGYILKNTGKAELSAALERIADNGTFYSSEVLNNMFDKFRRERKLAPEVKDLSERELEILRMVFEDKTSQEIADNLFISKRTVDAHRKNILQKTNTHTLVGLMRFALENDLVKIG
jgi:DNA-binding NarL/FixJ family response regulator